MAVRVPGSGSCGKTSATVSGETLGEFEAGRGRPGRTAGGAEGFARVAILWAATVAAAAVAWASGPGAAPALAQQVQVRRIAGEPEGPPGAIAAPLGATPAPASPETPGEVAPPGGRRPAPLPPQSSPPDHTPSDLPGPTANPSASAASSAGPSAAPAPGPAGAPAGAARAGEPAAAPPVPASAVPAAPVAPGDAGVGLGLGLGSRPGESQARTTYERVRTEAEEADAASRAARALRETREAERLRLLDGLKAELFDYRPARGLLLPLGGDTFLEDVALPDLEFAVVEWHGVERYVAARMRSAGRKRFREGLRDRLIEDARYDVNDHDEDLARFEARLYGEDPLYRMPFPSYWGGHPASARPVVVHMGEKLKVLDLAGLTLTNEGKLRFDVDGLFVADIAPADEDEADERALESARILAGSNLRKRAREIPNGSILTAERWKVSGGVQMRPSYEPAEALFGLGHRFRFKLDLTLFDDYFHDVDILETELEYSVEPFRNEHKFTVDIVITRF